MRDTTAATGGPRLWVIGGCHVLGYKIGEARPFWDGLARTLGIPRDRVEATGFASLGKCLELLQASERNRGADTLVLQLGHYDLHKRLNSSVGRKTGGSESGTESSAEPEAVSSGSYARKFLEGYVAMMADVVLVSPRETRERREEIRGLLDDILAEARRCGFGRIVMVSPFPGGGARQNRHRSAATAIMRAAAGAAGVDFVDTWDAIPRWPIYACPVPRRLLADLGHLNAEGHRLIDEALVAQHRRTIGKAPAWPVPTLAPRRERLPLRELALAPA